jgi:hypothetical protein
MLSFPPGKARRSLPGCSSVPKRTEVAVSGPCDWLLPPIFIRCSSSQGDLFPAAGQTRPSAVMASALKAALLALEVVWMDTYTVPFRNAIALSLKPPALNVP